jgi:hypothetical protein
LRSIETAGGEEDEGAAQFADQNYFNYLKAA